MDFVKSSTFPSGHVTGVVIFYGILSFLALNNTKNGKLRIAVPTLSVVIVSLASVSRVYVLAHWPTDILGSYLLGALGIIAIAWGYVRVKEDRLTIPRPWARKERPQADGWQEFVEPIDERYLKMAARLLFRADAAFAKPELYEYLGSKHIGYESRRSHPYGSRRRTGVATVNVTPVARPRAPQSP